MSKIDPASVTVVLANTLQPGNIGATARAMDNMGFQDLRLVNPCQYFHPDARKFAMSARYILEEAQVYDTLEKAVSDCHLVVGTSVRRRDKIQKFASLLDFSQNLNKFSGNSRIAFVFGNEKSGLDNEEMSFCNEWIFIPTHGKGSSLNLAQAVLVVLYEISKHFTLNNNQEENLLEPAISESIESMKGHFFDVMDKINYLRPGTRNSIWHSFSSLIGRAKPDERDVRMMRGFFNKIELSLKNKK